MREEHAEQIYLKEIWNKIEIYEGMTDKDKTILKSLRFEEWLARTSIIDYELVGRMLIELGLVEE